MLIPTLNALENVELPALLRGETDNQSRGSARALLEQLGLGKRLHHLPAQLSGGEQRGWRSPARLTVGLSCCLPMSLPAILTAIPATKLPICCFP